MKFGNGHNGFGSEAENALTSEVSAQGSMDECALMSEVFAMQSGDACAIMSQTDAQKCPTHTYQRA